MRAQRTRLAVEFGAAELFGDISIRDARLSFPIKRFHVYILSQINLDWSDEQSLAILKRCREDMKGDSRLLLIELVLNEEGVSGFGSADLVMMTLLGGALSS